MPAGGIDGVRGRPQRRAAGGLVAALALAAAVAGCGRGESPVVAAPGTVPPQAEAMAASSTSSTSSTSTTSSTTSSTTTTAPTTTTLPPRAVVEQAWTPYATVGGITLRHPSARVERVGFHESNHDGAQYQEPLPTAVHPTTLETRDRGTNAHGAADIVVDPAVEIRAPVTGTVLRAGTYVLYCEHADDFAVIEPDDHPGWEVKVLHIDGVQVSGGDRVVAGETVLATGPTQLPFESQVDELRTADPAWPHVHVEVVDPSVPDRPSPGGGCS